MKTEIKKIVLDLDGLEVAITPEQAKKLHTILDEMYGEKNHYYPVYIEPKIWWWDYPQPRWTCDTNKSYSMSYDSSANTLMCKI